MTNIKIEEPSDAVAEEVIDTAITVLKRRFESDETTQTTAKRAHIEKF